MKLRKRKRSLTDLEDGSVKSKSRLKKEKKLALSKRGKSETSAGSPSGKKRRRRRRAGETTKRLQLMCITSSCTNVDCPSLLADYKKYSNYDNPRCKYMSARDCKSRHGRIDYRGSYYACPRDPLCDAVICSDCHSLFRRVSKVDQDALLTELQWISEVKWDVILLFRFVEARKEAMHLQSCKKQTFFASSCCTDLPLCFAALESAGIKTLVCDYAMSTVVDASTIKQAIKQAKLVIVLGSKSFGTDDELDLFDAPNPKPFVFVKMCAKFTAIDARRLFPDHYAYCRWASGASMPTALMKIISSRLNPPKDSSGTTLTCPSGAIYTGEISKRQPHGKGVMIYPDGSRYQGSFYYGVRHGMGTYTYGAKSLHPLDQFNGCYLQNTRHGEGVYTYGQRSPYYGYKYKGTWEKGSRTLGGIILRDLPDNVRCLVCTKSNRKDEIVLCTSPEGEMHGAHYTCLGRGPELLQTAWTCLKHRRNGASPKIRRLKKRSTGVKRLPKKSAGSASGKAVVGTKGAPLVPKKRGRPKKVPIPASKAEIWKLGEPEGKLEDERGQRRQDNISLDTAPGDVVEVCDFPCLREGCAGEMKDYIEKECSERGVKCNLRESPECNERLGRIIQGMRFFTCGGRPKCHIDVCADCYPFENLVLGTDDTVLSPVVSHCIGTRCSVKLESFLEKSCDQRGVRCDLKRSQRCKKRFGKINLSSVFYSCPRFPKCTVDFCKSCYDFARKGGEGNLRQVRRLKPSLHFSEELSERLRKLRKLRTNKIAVKDWPPPEAKSVIEVKAKEPVSLVKSGKAQKSPETKKLQHVISSLKYTASTAK